MARKENMRRGPVNLFIFADGTDAINSHGWNSNNNPICVVPGCSRTAHNKGEAHGGFAHKCKEHLGLVGKRSYKNHKYVVPYCENIDGRLGFSCPWTTIPHPSMLTVDHIDEDRGEGDDIHNKANLQTLCSCCHAYKGNVIGKKVKSGKISLEDMLDYFEINKRIKKSTHTLDDMMRHHTINKILHIENNKINERTN
jgi:hypothetical protein